MYFDVVYTYTSEELSSIHNVLSGLDSEQINIIRSALDHYYGYCLRTSTFGHFRGIDTIILYLELFGKFPVSEADREGENKNDSCKK